MAKRNKRTKMKRSLAQAHNDLERVIHNLGGVHQEFVNHKSGLDKYLVVMIEQAAILQGHICKFWENAWGRVPDDINTWR